MARRTKYTPETVKKVHDALDLGVSYKHAAHFAGIGEATFWEWMKSKAEFQESIYARESRGAAAMMGLTMRAAKDDWRAATWILEHRWPEEYAKNRIEVEHSGTVSVEMLVEARTAVLHALKAYPEARTAVAAALEAVETRKAAKGKQQQQQGADNA